MSIIHFSIPSMAKQTGSSITKQRGISLIETLVAMLIFAVGLLGVASMQSLGLKASSNSKNMGVAVSEASNMADLMLSNPQAVRDGAFDSITGNVASASCSSSCSPAQLAQSDIYNWQQNLSAELPGSSSTIATNAATGLFTVEISWTERGKESDETKTHSITFMPYSP